jgi:CheY-like chemotaxis protein
MNFADPLILVADDDVNDQIFIRRALKRSAFPNRVAVVNDGEEAAAYLRGFDLYADRNLHPLPRLIITDVKMPRMGGVELLAWMNGQAEFRVIPTVVLTSSADQAAINAAFAVGAKGYLLKPVHYAELERLVHMVVEYWTASCLPARV